MRLLSRKILSMMGSAALALLWGCGPVSEQEALLDETTGGQQVGTMESLLTTAQKRARCDAIKAITGPRGITNPLVYAGIAHHETGLAQCWSEATWACQGPHSSDCGGPVIAGSGDGACSLQQGGLGMYQLDSGTYSQTLAAHGNGILNIGGNIQAGVNVIINKVRVCPNTRAMFTNDAQAIAWINTARPGTSAFETFLTTMAWCYNGCSPTGCSNHNNMREKYRSATESLRTLFGDAYWSGSCTVGGAILERYNSLGGAGGILGACTTSELTTPDGVGRYNHFQNGSIYWTPTTGAWAVNGNIHAKWAALGWETSALGYPITNETATPDGVGRYNHFQNGSIYWTQATGAFEVRGFIREKWSALGWETSPLGYPTTDELGTPDKVGRYNHFQNGSIYWTPETGAHEVRGLIHAKWSSLGWETSYLGYPTTDEVVAADGVGRYNHFQRGSIYFTPATGAHEVIGDINNKWVALGREAGLLGYPLTDETKTPDGVGRFNHFQNGSIYWTPTTGAHEVHGPIRAKWESLGWETGALGYPVKDEYAVTGGRESEFQKGFLTLNTTTNTVTVRMK